MLICNEKLPFPFSYLTLDSNQADETSKLPNVLWRQGVCSELQQLETHSKCVLIPAEARLFRKGALLTNRESSTQQFQGDQHPTAISKMTQNKMLEASNLQCKLHSVEELQPQWWLAMKSNLAFFTPRSSFVQTYGHTPPLNDLWALGVCSGLQ